MKPFLVQWIEVKGVSHKCSKNPMINRLRLIFLVGLCLFMVGCGRTVADDQQEWTQKVSDQLIEKGTIPKVGVILSNTDSYMNQLVVNSLTGFTKNRIVDLRVVFHNEIPITQDAVKYLAENNYTMIIGLAPDYEQAVSKLRNKYPETTFVTIDTEVEGANTLSLVFKEEEGGYLAGVLAGMINKTGLVGFVGGKADDPQVLAYQAGFYQGVRYVNQKFNKDIRINSKFVGYFDKDIKPEKAKDITVQQYTYGADVIFQVAGKAAEGVFQGANQRGGLVIGSEVNQNWKLPGLVPASIVKNFETVLINVVNQFALGKPPRGVLVYSLKNNGIRLTDMRNLEGSERVGVKQKQPVMDKILEIKNRVADEAVVELQEVRSQISQGNIKVSEQLSEGYLKSLSPIPQTPQP